MKSSLLKNKKSIPTPSYHPQESSYPLPIPVPEVLYYHHQESFLLESGEQLPSLTIAYHTYGQLNEQKDNVIWVCHALTANSNVADWWAGLFGPGKVYDTEQYFIVCANILGSCYGSTCPRSRMAENGAAYGLDFPLLTIRDIAKANICLFEHLKIESIALCVGGSCGGHQVMEMAFLIPEQIQRMVLLVTSAKETAWAIAIHEAGRMAMEADPSFQENTDRAGAAGLKAARGVGLLSYRTVDSYIQTQSDDDERTDDFRASSYIRYQGYKLERRFYAHCYWYLLKALDSHDVGRHRGGLEKALGSINIPALVIAIDTDQLIPSSQQKILAKHLANATYCEVQSDYGHDGFLIETEQINTAILDWMAN